MAQKSAPSQRPNRGPQRTEAAEVAREARAVFDHGGKRGAASTCVDILPVDTIVRIARRIISRWGMATIPDVVASVCTVEPGACGSGGALSLFFETGLGLATRAVPDVSYNAAVDGGVLVVVWSKNRSHPWAE
jgi:hypothetical protein